MGKALSEAEKGSLQLWARDAARLLELAKTRDLEPSDFNEVSWVVVYVNLRDVKYQSYDFTSGLSDDQRQDIALIFEYASSRYNPKQGKKPQAGESNWEKHREYMRSLAWVQKRYQAIKHAGNKCQLCGTHRAVFQVHHNSYKNLGNEPLEDLIVLCTPCHDMFHQHSKLSGE